MYTTLFENATLIDTSTLDALELLASAHKAENLSETTTQGYRWTIEYWRRRWPELAIFQVQPIHVREFIIWLQGKDPQRPPPSKFKSSTVHLHFRNIKAFLRFCRAEGLFDHDPLRNVKPPKVEETIPDILSEYEAADMLKALKAGDDRHSFRDYVIHFLFLQTGIRLSELKELNITDIHLAGCFARIHDKKNKNERLVPLGTLLPLEIRRYILKHRRATYGETALFINEYGKRLQIKGIKSAVYRSLAKHINRKVIRGGPHTFRHSACTFMLRQTKDIHQVSAIMGHKDIATTQRYIHLTYGDIITGEKRPSLEELMQSKRSKLPKVKPNPIPELDALIRS